MQQIHPARPVAPEFSNRNVELVNVSRSPDQPKSASFKLSLSQYGHGVLGESDLKDEVPSRGQSDFARISEISSHFIDQSEQLRSKPRANSRLTAEQRARLDRLEDRQQMNVGMQDLQIRLEFEKRK